MKCFKLSAVFVFGLLLASCGRDINGPDAAPELSGAGFVHYHLYPDTGQCYCGIDFDFKQYGKMIAAASESIHHYFHDSLCQNKKYAVLKSETSGKTIRVLIVDKGGQPTSDFNAREQHIMDLSREAFDSLDVNGEGVNAGRIYVTWSIVSAEGR